GRSYIRYVRDRSPRSRGRLTGVQRAIAMVTFEKIFFLMISSRCFETASAHGSATPTRPIFFALDGVSGTCALIVSSSRNIKLAGIAAIASQSPASPHFFEVVAK